MVCPLLKVINPLSRLLTGDFTYQRGIGNNSHSVSGLCLARLGTAECVCFLFRLLGSRAVGHGPRAHWMGRWGCRRRCLHAAGQLRQAAFHRHRHWGGERFHGFLEPRRGFLLWCHHPETRVFWEISVQSRLFALHRSRDCMDLSWHSLSQRERWNILHVWGNCAEFLFNFFSCTTFGKCGVFVSWHFCWFPWLQL